MMLDWDTFEGRQVVSKPAKIATLTWTRMTSVIARLQGYGRQFEKLGCVLLSRFTENNCNK